MTDQQTIVPAPDSTKADANVVNNAQPQTDADKFYAKAETPDAKVEGQAKQETKVEETKVEAKAPDKFELKLSEGSALDQSAVERISSLAKEKGLSQEQAQAMLSEQDALVTSYRDQQLQQHAEARKAWVEAVKTDKEFGGEKLNENLEIAKRVINEFADDELKTALNNTGYGDHPALFKFVVKMGQKLKVLNDSYVKASAPSVPKKEPYEVFYSKE